MDSTELRTHLEKVKLGDLKDLIRKYNLHYKIKLTQKKPDLIDAIVSHFDELEAGMLTSKTAKFDMPSAEVKDNNPMLSTESKADRLKYIEDNKTKLLKIDNIKFKELKIVSEKLYNELKNLKNKYMNEEESKQIKQGVKITDKVTDMINKLVNDKAEVKALSKIQDTATNTFQDFMVKSNEAVRILNSKKPLTIKMVDYIYKNFDLYK